MSHNQAHRVSLHAQTEYENLRDNYLRKVPN